MRSLRFIRIWLAAGWALVGLVVVLSLIPSPPKPLSFYGADKVSHLAVYSVLMIWFGSIYLPGRAHVRFAAGFVLLGVVLELAQGFTGFRSAQGLDALANATGVGVGWCLARTRLAHVFTILESRLPGATTGKAPNGP